MRRIRKRDERGRFVARGVSPRTRSRPLLGKSEDCGEERPGVEKKQLSFAQPTAVQQAYPLTFDDGESEQWEDVTKKSAQGGQEELNPSGIIQNSGEDLRI